MALDDILDLAFENRGGVREHARTARGAEPTSFGEALGLVHLRSRGEAIGVFRPVRRRGY